MPEPLTVEQERLVSENTGLVGFVLKRLGRRPTEMDWDDMYQDGLFGLVKAARGFDPDKGFKFSTYAVRTIWGYVMHGRRVWVGNGDRPRIMALSLDAEWGEDGAALADLVADHNASFEEDVANRDRIGRALGSLPQKEAMALIAHSDPHGVSEMAQREGVVGQTIRNRAARARRRIAVHDAGQ